MSHPKVSIIVPVYGVEQYIERCSRSLFEQSYNDEIEYIFINDCSKDHSIDILKRVIEDYPHRKAQVKIINHDINKGLPQARRTGILEAVGDYIISVDSDDWVDHSMVEKLTKRAESEKSDIVIYDYATVDNNGTVIKVFKGCLNIEKKALIEDMCAMRVSWSACNKMFKRSLITQSIEFPRDNMGEDMALMMQVVIAAHGFSYEPEVFYFYYTNPQSMTQIIDEEKQYAKYLQLKRNTEIVLDAFSKYKLTQHYHSSIDVIKWNLRKCLWGLIFKQEYREIWRSTYPEIRYRILINSQLSLHDKICYILTLLGMYPRRKHRIV